MIQDASESGKTDHAKDFPMKAIIHGGSDGQCSGDCYDICFSDYTLWRRHFDDVPADDWNRAAAKHARLHPFRPKRPQRPLPDSPFGSV